MADEIKLYKQKKKEKTKKRKEGGRETATHFNRQANNNKIVDQNVYASQMR